jgi:sugar lactone lactonase YvrE
MKSILLFLLSLILVLAAVLWIRYGGGDSYPNLLQPAIIADSELQEVLAYPEPIGNVAVSASGEVFFTVHPESRPQGNKLLQFVDGASVPFPDVQLQGDLFDTVLGVVIDQQNRLWTIDHGNHGMRTARLLAFDLDSGELVHDKKFDETIAPLGSFLQDLQVSADGHTVVIADASLWRKRPALIVYNTDKATARRVLEGHASLSAENYVISNDGRDMKFAAGLVTLRGGVDGMAIDAEWLYFGALSGAGLYRIPVRELIDPDNNDAKLAAVLERYADKPLSDGFSIDTAGNVYVTDVEHGAVFRIGADREPVTLIRSTKIRWPDALSFGPEGWLYVADSDLYNVVLQPRDHIKTHGPYKIFRFAAGIEGVPGH